MGRRESLQAIEYFRNLDLNYCFDSLTGILNRETLIGYVNWLVQEKRQFSFFLIDIDNFKNVNDTYGHLVGDMVIAQTAQHFVKMTEPRGVVARYGGDEFVIVLDGVNEYNDVWKFGHAMNMSMGDIAFEGIPNLAITVSMGIARSPLDADSYTEIMEVADKALYRAKMKGRNCFIIYLPEKHAKISLKKERDKQLNSMQRCFNFFNALMACGEDISIAVSSVFKSLISNYMFDHICLETHTRLSHSVIFTLCESKRFTHIPYDVISSLINSAGFVSVSQVDALDDEFYGDIKEACKKQKVVSTLLCKISAYGVDYGFIRVDACNTCRLWQNNEISMLIVAANALGLLLHYQHKTLDDLPLVAPSEAGSI